MIFRAEYYIEREIDIQIPWKWCVLMSVTDGWAGQAFSKPGQLKQAAQGCAWWVFSISKDEDSANSLSIFFSRLNNPSSLHLTSSIRCSSPLIIFVVLHWTCFNMSHFFLSWKAQNWTQHLRCDITSLSDVVSCNQSPQQRPWKMGDPSVQIGPCHPAATGGVLLWGTGCILLLMVQWMEFPPRPLATAGVFIARWFTASAGDGFIPSLNHIRSVTNISLSHERSRRLSSSWTLQYLQCHTTKHC